MIDAQTVLETRVTMEPYHKLIFKNRSQQLPDLQTTRK
jgi:hypothetical protein